VIVGVIRRKPVLTHASIVCEGMLASVNSVNKFTGSTDKCLPISAIFLARQLFKYIAVTVVLAQSDKVLDAAVESTLNYLTTIKNHILNCCTSHIRGPPIRELSHPTIIVTKQHSFQSIWLRWLQLIFYANVLTTLSRFQLLHMDLELEPPPNLGNEYPNLAHIYADTQWK